MQNAECKVQISGSTAKDAKNPTFEQKGAKIAKAKGKGAGSDRIQRIYRISEVGSGSRKSCGSCRFGRSSFPGFQMSKSRFGAWGVEVRPTGVYRTRLSALFVGRWVSGARKLICSHRKYGANDVSSTSFFVKILAENLLRLLPLKEKSGCDSAIAIPRFGHGTRPDHPVAQKGN
jgi:hypothetical protein